MSQVSVLNADGTFMKRTSLHHAVSMIVRRVAEPHEWIEGERFGEFPLVTAVILVAAKYIYPKWLDKPATFGPDALRARHKGRCAYCGVACKGEVEHIYPKSLGGQKTWLNTVLACRDCNARKRDRTPEQAGMKILPGHEPYIPTKRDILTGKSQMAKA